MRADREALLRTTLAMTVEQRVEWLERMMAIALETGALPKRVPDQERSRLAQSRNSEADGAIGAPGEGSR